MIDERLNGNWKHVKKSQEWENYHENYAKGKVGTFSESGKYLKWESNDGKVTMFIEVNRIAFYEKTDSVVISHRSGLMHWFQKSGDKDGNKKKEATKGRDSSSRYGR